VLGVWSSQIPLVLEIVELVFVYLFSLGEVAAQGTPDGFKHHDFAVAGHDYIIDQVVECGWDVVQELVEDDGVVSGFFEPADFVVGVEELVLELVDGVEHGYSP